MHLKYTYIVVQRKYLQLTLILIIKHNILRIFYFIRRSVYLYCVSTKHVPMFQDLF